ncbi:MurR/RpiR family transcriptional regulator [Alkalihalophilus marmarensis]|uniref:RpiR family transcriptional regulator n=1 Tax=Alkalihalophilus marmarensis DSM 21297 TaxID=1188261 RepID=U6SP97_9BACI|nr:MurR/RpiR family transcriptional regulator [Alkalihalophilus marmarensis]ERN52735.1 RpiR family transcriptional regulator [Alkalihalophilus marmarensis DSM 21297]MCM3488041.1 MurR/RpiR family transcriptional regulator [Alkalihalophilus marmarensis]MED1600962.1 MurR/RpiR family transcriptional regulator [Alkalihalophilus marmarensis]
MIKNEVYQRMVDKQGEMSKSQKKIAAYLLKHTETAPFLTASKLAKLTEVGEATVVRFAVSLGFSGYPELQKEMQNALQMKMTSAEMFAQTIPDHNEKQNLLTDMLKDDITNLQLTLNQIDHTAFNKAAEEIVKANRIYILAYRSAVSLGKFLSFYLDLVLQNTELIEHADGMSEHLLDIKEGDLVIAFGFARYTKRTVDALKYVKEKDVKTIVITDHPLSPLAPYGTITLHTSTEINSFIDSFTAPMSVINALLTAVTRSEHVKVEKRLQELEELWEAFDVFYE